MKYTQSIHLWKIFAELFEENLYSIDQNFGWHFLLDWMPMASKPPSSNRKFFVYFPSSHPANVNSIENKRLDENDPDIKIFVFTRFSLHSRGGRGGHGEIAL